MISEEEDERNPNLLADLFEDFAQDTKEDKPFWEIAELVRTGAFTQLEIEALEAKYPVLQTNAFKAGAYALIVNFLNKVLDNDLLTVQEAQQVHLLRGLFNIEPGELWQKCEDEIRGLFEQQLQLILADHIVTHHEALMIVDLQLLFKLTNEQVHDICRPMLLKAIENGANPTDLDFIGLPLK